MTDYQVEMLGEENEKLIGQYVSKLNELLAAAEEAAKQETSNEENSESTEDGTEEVKETVTE